MCRQSWADSLRLHDLRTGLFQILFTTAENGRPRKSLNVVMSKWVQDSASLLPQETGTREILPTCYIRR